MTKYSTPSPIKHARIAIIIIGLGVLTSFIIRCIQTNFYEEIDIIIACPIITQLLLWFGLLLSYRRAFLGLAIPTILFIATSIHELTTRTNWDLSPEFWGNCTGVFLFNFFTIRGCIYAIKHYGIAGTTSPKHKI